MTSEEAKETILEYQRTKDEVLWEKIYSNYEPIIKFGGHNECYNMNLPKEHIEYVQNIKL